MIGLFDRILRPGFRDMVKYGAAKRRVRAELRPDAMTEVQRPAPSPRHLWADLSAANETVDSILLVGITIIAAAGLVAILVSQEPPADKVHADFLLALDEGSAGWASGDERVVLTHVGGEAVPENGTSVLLSVGTTTQRIAGEDLAFGDGSLHAGDAWTRTLNLGVGTPVSVELIVDALTAGRIGASGAAAGSASGTHTSAIFFGSVTAQARDCTADLTAPLLSLWVQSPDDVHTGTVGAVRVTAEFSDDCSGVETALDPVLFTRIRGTTTPAWTSLGAMTLVGPGAWTGSIPEPLLGWDGHAGEAFEYYVGPMPADEAGNGGGGDSDIVTDLIQFVGAGPDLTSQILGLSPASPDVGDSVTFTVRLSNSGAEASPPGVPIVVDFAMDGVPLGSTSVAGPLAVGAFVDLVSPAWLGAYGIHTATATADPLDAIDEEDETDNVGTLVFQITTAVFDPGFAYEDVNNDGLYDPLVDNAIPNVDILDCVYHSPYGLVVPPSVGDINNANDDCHLTALLNLHVAINIATDNGYINVTSFGGFVDMYGFTLDAKNDDVTVWALGGDADLTSSSALGAMNAIVSVYAAGAILADGSYFEAKNKPVTLIAVEDIWINGATLIGNKWVTVESQDGAIFANETTVVSEIEDTNWDAATGIWAWGSSFTTARLLFIDTSAGPIHMNDTTVNAGANGVYVTSGGDLDVSGTAFVVSNDLELAVGGAGNTLFVQGATFNDGNDQAKVTPVGALVVGVPAFGTWTY